MTDLVEMGKQGITERQSLGCDYVVQWCTFHSRCHRSHSPARCREQTFQVLRQHTRLAARNWPGSLMLVPPPPTDGGQGSLEYIFYNEVLVVPLL